MTTAAPPVSLRKRYVDRWPGEHRALAADLYDVLGDWRAVTSWMTYVPPSWTADDLLVSARRWNDSVQQIKDIGVKRAAMSIGGAQAVTWTDAGYSAQQAGFMHEIVSLSNPQLTNGQVGDHLLFWRVSGLPAWWACLSIAAGENQLEAERRLRRSTDDPSQVGLLTLMTALRGVDIRAMTIDRRAFRATMARPAV